MTSIAMSAFRSSARACRTISRKTPRCALVPPLAKDKLALFKMKGFFEAKGQPPPDSKSCFEGATRKAPDCCPLPPLIEKNIVDDCREKYIDLKIVPGAKRREGSCIAQCVFHDIKAFNASSNTLDKEAVEKVILQTAGSNEDIGSMLSKIISDCHGRVTKNPVFLIQPISTVPGRAGCSFLPQALINCIKTELFTNCPSSLWFGGPECDKLKQKLSVGCSFSSIVG
ncbi:general odorant-binding protein 67-like [Topomyia yanbarensis]|uniref:general odorant-binding protein 67-like n=1 Tax=Topomyia yanbarensis TaxID=2498891 RepID=UPI00273B2D99|nr:general odorant-binding protein 67-like [Topomyia yanbarensis]